MCGDGGGGEAGNVKVRSEVVLPWAAVARGKVQPPDPHPSTPLSDTDNSER